MINPVPAKVGSYPPGTTIVGNELRAAQGGFRAWFEFQIDDWDPNGDGVPGVRFAYVRLDSSGFVGSEAPAVQPDLERPLIPCSDPSPCVAAFGESWAKCELGFCNYAYADRLGAHPNSWCADTGFGPCDLNECSVSSSNPVCGPIYPVARPDDGTVKYFASLVLDVPAGARGRYVVNYVPDETTLGDDQAPPNEVPTLLEQGFVVHIVTGLCCYGLGTACAACVDSVTAAECGDDEPGPYLFTPEGSCADAKYPCNVPDCDDDDPCTVDSGCAGNCSHIPKSGWNPNTGCCNAADGSVDLLLNSDPCQAPTCSLPGSRGDMVLVPKPEGSQCAYHDLCFTSGTCDVTGRCVGALSQDPGCWKNRVLTLMPDDTGEIFAIRVTMIDLENPDPPNAPQFPPTDFSAYEAGATCTDTGGCARWVGSLQTYPECVFDNPAAGAFRTARLQCTPFYHEWGVEGLFHITGGEVVPSSRYDVEFVPVSCQGMEDTCPNVPAAVEMRTARYGDVAPQFNPPSTAGQPDALDIAALVDKYKCLPGSYAKAATQTQPNVPEHYRQHTGLDIVNVIDAFKGFAFPFTGPCPCPSVVTCDATPCTSSTQCANGGVCYKTCVGGIADGGPCQFGEHCPGGSCGAGFCRDACARCTP
jgi:hypothetical protein